MKGEGFTPWWIFLILAKVDDMQKVEDVHMIIVHMTMERILEELK